jgi:hypothetical protein
MFNLSEYRNKPSSLADFLPWAALVADGIVLNKDGKVTIVLSELLKEELDAYAAEHSKLYEPVETVAMIPHMLEAFLRADRAWCGRRKQMRQARTSQRRTKSTAMQT